MKAYWLLRNNGQSGPYTAAQLLAENLRASDLVREEGNFTWSYPYEVEEFKAHMQVIAAQTNVPRVVNRIDPPVTGSDESPAIKQAATEEMQIPYFLHTQPEIKGIMIEIKDVKPETEQPLFEVREKQDVIPNPAENNSPTGSGKPRIRIKADASRLQTTTTTPVPFKSYGPPKKKLSSGSLDWQKGWLDWEQDRREIEFRDREKQPAVINSISYSKPANTQQVSPQKDSVKVGNDALKRMYNIPVRYVFPAVALAIMTGLAFWIGTIEGRPTSNLPVNDADKTQSGTKDEQQLQSHESSLQDGREPATGDATVVYTLQKNDPHRHSTTGKAGDNYSYETGKKVAGKTNDIRVDQVKEADYAQPLPENKVVAASKKEENKPAPAATKKQTVKDFIRVKNNSIPLNTNGTDNTLQVQNISNISFNLVVIDLQYYDAEGHYRKGETMYLRNFNAGKSLNVRIPEDESSVKATANVSMISSDENNIYLVTE